MRLVYGLLAAAIFSIFASPVSAADRPNVVLFIADDLSWADCPPAGGSAPPTPTPNMLRVAQAGMTFTQAFVASPSCAPSRSRWVRWSVLQHSSAPTRRFRRFTKPVCA